MLQHHLPKRTFLQVLTPRLTLILVLTIVLIVVFSAISIWQVTTWQQALSANNTIEKKINKVSKTVRTKLQPLSVIQKDLPALPKVEQRRQVTKINAKTQQVKHVAVTKTVSAMYQQLISDNSINIEIAWPDNEVNRQNIFSFLYECIGMQFGVLNNQQVTLVKNHYQGVSDTPPNQASDWLRVAQGQLANQERHWLQQYYLSGTPVRLFPKAVDWQLAQLLAKHLKKESLQHFRARYQQTGYRLMLTDIKVNGQALSNDWTLITSHCDVSS